MKEVFKLVLYVIKISWLQTLSLISVSLLIYGGYSAEGLSILIYGVPFLCITIWALEDLKKKKRK